MAEPRPPVNWSPDALNDVDHLWEYYASVANPDVANKVLREIAGVVAAIDDFPLAGRSRDDVRAGLRSLSAGSHVIFYRLRDDRPEIVRVLDGRRDIDEIFSEGDGGTNP